jgi:hypothetical protein
MQEELEIGNAALSLWLLFMNGHWVKTRRSYNQRKVRFIAGYAHGLTQQ